MNKLEIILRTNKCLEPIVEVDGNIVKATKNKFGGKTAVYETEKSDVSVKIYTLPNELLAKNWFLRVLFYYIISFFGIFDWAYSKSQYGVKYMADYHLDGDMVLNLKWNKLIGGDKALYPKEEDSAFIDNDTNVFTYDKRVKNRYNGMLAFKIISWIAIVAIIVLVVIL